jgi:hypothetical protein
MCPFSQAKQGDLECHKDGCTLNNTYMNELQANFDPAKKDDVIANLVSNYGFGDNNTFIQNLATTFVELLVQYPSCLPLSSAQSNQLCSDNQYKTLLSYSNGIMEFSCNYPKPDPPPVSEGKT